MGTSSYIGILNKDMSCDAIYCQNDGYISFNGKNTGKLL